MENINKTFVAVDVETTGLEPGSRMIELGAVLFDNKNGMIDEFERLVNPGMPIPEDASKVNGITNDMLADKPNAGTVLRDFFDWLLSYELIAHCACYDAGIISWEAGRFAVEIPSITVIDTLDLAKTIGETKDNKLATLAKHYGIKNIGEDHRALNDAHLCAEYFRFIHSRPIRQTPWAMTGHDYSYTDELPKGLSALPDLVEKAEQLSFTYKDAKDNVTVRSITPYGWALTSSGLTFHGECHLRKARRVFRADRVMGIIVNDSSSDLGIFGQEGGVA